MVMPTMIIVVERYPLGYCLFLELGSIVDVIVGESDGEGESAGEDEYVGEFVGAIVFFRIEIDCSFDGYCAVEGMFTYCYVIGIIVVEIQLLE